MKELTKTEMEQVNGGFGFSGGGDDPVEDIKEKLREILRRLRERQRNIPAPFV